MKVWDDLWLFFVRVCFILENSRMKHSVKGSSRKRIVMMKPQLDSSVTHQPSDRKKHAKVTHNVTHVVHFMSVSQLIYFTSIIWICSSNQNFNLYSESFTALAFKAHRLRKKEAVDCGDSKVQTQKPTGPRFTSSLYFRLSRNLGLDNPELRVKKNLDRRLHR